MSWNHTSPNFILDREYEKQALPEEKPEGEEAEKHYGQDWTEEEYLQHEENARIRDEQQIADDSVAQKPSQNQRP